MFYKISEVAKILNVPNYRVYNLIRAHKIKTNKKSVHTVSKAQLTLLKKYKETANDFSKQRRYSKDKIRIIDFYITHPNNSVHLISNQLSLNYTFVNQTINEWLKNEKTIIVASKL